MASSIQLPFTISLKCKCNNILAMNARTIENDNVYVERETLRTT
jgi:hypothetical protein